MCPELSTQLTSWTSMIPSTNLLLNNEKLDLNNKIYKLPFSQYDLSYLVICL